MGYQRLQNAQERVLDAWSTRCPLGGGRAVFQLFDTVESVDPLPGLEYVASSGFTPADLRSLGFSFLLYEEFVLCRAFQEEGGVITTAFVKDPAQVDGKWDIARCPTPKSY